MPILRIEIESRDEWGNVVTNVHHYDCEGAIDLKTEYIVKPDPSMKVNWFEKADDAAMDITFKTITDQMITIKAKQVQAGPPNYAYAAKTAEEIEAENKKYALARENARKRKEEEDALSPEEVADALEAAADLFLTKGWTQGTYHRKKEW